MTHFLSLNNNPKSVQPQSTLSEGLLKEQKKIFVRKSSNDRILNLQKKFESNLPQQPIAIKISKFSKTNNNSIPSTPKPSAKKTSRTAWISSTFKFAQEKFYQLTGSINTCFLKTIEFITKPFQKSDESHAPCENQDPVKSSNFSSFTVTPVPLESFVKKTNEIGQSIIQEQSKTDSLPSTPSLSKSHFIRPLPSIPHPKISPNRPLPELPILVAPRIESHKESVIQPIIIAEHKAFVQETPEILLNGLHPELPVLIAPSIESYKESDIQPKIISEKEVFIEESHAFISIPELKIENEREEKKEEYSEAVESDALEKQNLIEDPIHEKRIESPANSFLNDSSEDEIGLSKDAEPKVEKEEEKQEEIKQHLFQSMSFYNQAFNGDEEEEDEVEDFDFKEIKINNLLNKPLPIPNKEVISVGNTVQELKKAAPRSFLGEIVSFKTNRLRKVAVQKNEKNIPENEMLLSLQKKSDRFQLLAAAKCIAENDLLADVDNDFDD